MSEKDTLEKLDEEYIRSMHAVQSGVKAMIQTGDDGASPKHLRVGVDSAMISDAALVNLLVSKGVITMDEFKLALVEEARAEVGRYEAELSKRLGRTVKLG